MSLVPLGMKPGLEPHTCLRTKWLITNVNRYLTIKTVKIELYMNIILNVFILFTFAVLGTETRASHSLGKCATTGLHL